MGCVDLSQPMRAEHTPTKKDELAFASTEFRAAVRLALQSEAPAREIAGLSLHSHGLLHRCHCTTRRVRRIGWSGVSTAQRRGEERRGRRERGEQRTDTGTTPAQANTEKPCRRTAFLTGPTRSAVSGVIPRHHCSPMSRAPPGVLCSHRRDSLRGHDRAFHRPRIPARRVLRK